MEYPCDCAEYCDEGEAASVCRLRMTTARKPWKCSECGRTIEAGEIYELIVGKWETIETFRTCIGCKRLRDDCGGCYFGGLDDMVQECLGTTIMHFADLDDGDDGDDEDEEHTDA